MRNKMFPSGEIPINGIMDKETNFFVSFIVSLFRVAQCIPILTQNLDTL